MRYKFSNKKELELLLDALKNNLTKGHLFIDDSDENNGSIISDQNLPGEVKKFFNDNAIKPYKILNDLPVPFFIKDKNCGWFYMNKAFCDFFELNPSDIYRKTSHAIFPKNKADLFYKQDCNVLQTGKESSLEMEITTPAGKTRFIQATKSLFNDINNIPYIIGTFNEITGFKDIESAIQLEKTELESQVKSRTALLSATVEKLREEILQREKTEQALIQEEDKFRSVIEQATDGIVINDNKGRIIEWNQSMFELTGVKKEQALGKNNWDIEFQLMKPEKKTDDYYKNLQTNLLKTLGNEYIPKKAQNFEGEIIRTDGKRKFVNITTFLIKTSNSVYLGRIARDVSEQKKSVLAIQRSEAQYRAIFESFSLAILIINPENYKIMAANKKAADIYNYPIDQFNGMLLEQITKDFILDAGQIEMIYKKNNPKDLETIHLSRNGEEINMMVNGSVVEYGGIKAVMTFNRNITDLKQLEKARETVYKISQLTHTVTNIDDLYKSIHIIINEILPAKNFYIALYDETKDMVFFPYYVDEKDAAPQARRLRRGLTEYVLRHGKPVLTSPTLLRQLEMSGEIEVIGSDTDIWLGAPLITHNKVIGVVAVQSYSEATIFTETEKDMLVYASEQIAHQIYKRQAEEEILQGKAKAEESDRLKTSLIANMNHDLRTPMTGVLGFASLLKNRVKDPESLNMIDTIIESGNKLMSTITSILQFSQIEASQKPVDYITGSLSKYAEISINQFENRAKQKNLYIIRQCNDPVFATFNENYLIQILNNLISNAVSYTEKGGMTVKTGYTSYLENDYAFISVEDTGIGISENNFNLIFQEFRQVSEGLNRKYEGSGLGLSLSKKMAESMGGKILVESAIGKGSVFTLLLPVSSPQLSRKPENDYSTSYYKLNGAIKTRYKVLVVEDNRINGELISAMLKQDYEVDIAKTGILAIELVKRGNYDIILMDINLGVGMTGIQAAKEIHRLKGELPIVAMTAYSTEKEIDQIMKHSFIGFVLKPIDKTALFKVMEKSIIKKTNSGK